MSEKLYCCRCLRPVEDGTRYVTVEQDGYSRLAHRGCADNIGSEVKDEHIDGINADGEFVKPVRPAA